MNDQLENFSRAFSSGSGGCVRTCECGRVFYDTQPGYTWEDGEFEALTANKNATALDYSVGTLCFEGKEYCMDCDCWHPRARRIIEWIESHGQSIAEFLTLEKKRKQADADQSPVVR